MASVDSPPPRDYGQETRDTLQAQVDLAPDRYAAEAEFGPRYTALNIRNLRTALLGDGTQPGLLETYSRDVYPALARIENEGRDSRIAGEMDAIQKYAPGVTRTLREASGNAPLLDALTGEAIEGIEAGAGMDASLANEVEQGVRAGQAARGFGFGKPDVVAEAFARGSRGQALRRERQQFAQGVVAQNQATSGDPFMAILGRPSQTLSAGQGVVSQGAGFNPGTVFNPESGYAQDVFDSNFNAANAASIADANNTNALIGAGISAAGSVGKGASM